jgi:uncharacterized protein (DUF1330 family)
MPRFEDYDDSPRPKPSSSNTVAWLIGGLIAAVLLLVVVCGGGLWFMAVRVREAATEFRAAVEKAQVEQRAARAAAVTVTPQELARAYATDEQAAHQKYGDKFLRLTGVVERLGKDAEGEDFIVLKPGNEGLQVECYFDGDDDMPPPKLQPGQEVTLVGMCTGKEGNVQIHQCELVK